MTGVGSGAGSQLLGSTTSTELHHARSRLPKWGGEEEEAWAFPWGGQEGRTTSACVVLVSALGWSQPRARASPSAFPQRLFGLMNSSAIDVPPDIKTFYLTNVFPLYLHSIDTTPARGLQRGSCWETLPLHFFFLHPLLWAEQIHPHGWTAAIYCSPWYAAQSSV